MKIDVADPTEKRESHAGESVALEHRLVGLRAAFFGTDRRITQRLVIIGTVRGSLLGSLYL